MKWEYRVEPQAWNEQHYENSWKILQCMGEMRWELVTIYDGLAFFKRLKENDKGEV